MYTFAGVAEVKLYWIGPVTMHRVARDGIASVVPNYLKLTSNDIVILCFGEIDCRWHIRKQGKKNDTSSIEEVDILTARYAKAVAEFQRQTRATVALSCVTPFVRPNVRCDLYKSRDECLTDTKNIRERMNRNLAVLGYPFVDFFHEVSAPDGAFLPDFSDGYCHLDSRRSEPVRKALEGLFLARFTHRDPPWPHPRALVEKAPVSKTRRLRKAIQHLLKSLVLKLPWIRAFRKIHKSAPPK
ncbi:lysophospholipase L1-like esterase [Labrenzia sp. EL_208]|nr:lysophospholipase L1-like esterase [Labrenzia sp. EL_132]MBG6229540.1 lysophospholipase L1-like esterase [Labrenzia sp. EL_208]